MPFVRFVTAHAALQVNLTAAMELTDALQSSGAMSSDGRVVFLSSINGIAGAAGQTNYGSSKAGLLGLARRMGEARSGPGSAQRGTVNAVAPGFIETDMTAAVPLLVSAVYSPLPPCR